jgi:large subunit ribosomal protein L25
MNFIELHATIREKFGTRSAKALRKEKKVPAVIYSKTTPTQAIALDKEEVKKKLSIHHHFYLIKVDSKEYKVFLKEVQRNHLGSEIYHIDF